MDYINIPIKPKERNFIGSQNDIIKTIFEKPVLIDGYVVAEEPLLEIGEHCIQITEDNVILENIYAYDNYDDTKNVLSWNYRDIYEAIRDDKKKIESIEIKNNKISFTGDMYSKKIMKIKSKERYTNIESHINIQTFLSKEYTEIPISEEYINSLSKNELYTAIDIGVTTLRISKQLIPTFKSTKSHTSKVKLLIQAVENNDDVMKALFIIDNDTTISYHMYAFLVVK